MDFYRFCIILKFIDISKNILVQNPDKGPLRFTPLDSTQHCTGGPPSPILALVRMLDGFTPVFPPRPAPVCCRPELWPLLGPSEATPLLATMLTLDTDQTRKAHTTLRQLKTTVLLDINQRRFWSPLSIAYDLLIRSKCNEYVNAKLRYYI